MDQTLKNNWSEIKHEIRQVWNKITDAEVDNVQGNFSNLAKLIQERYQLSQAQAREQIDDIVARFKNRSSQAIPKGNRGRHGPDTSRPSV